MQYGWQDEAVKCRRVGILPRVLRLGARPQRPVAKQIPRAREPIGAGMGHTLVCLAPPGGGLPGHDEGGDHDDVEAESLSTTVVKVHRCCGG